MENIQPWWKDGKYGMFIHFGLYSATEGYWNGEEVPFIGEWIQFKKQVPLNDYKTLTEKLNLKGFDAKQYVEFAKNAGMKYIVITAKHHDGFAMYNSKVSDYNITKMCADHRDPCMELAQECKKQGIKICFYYSQALDWEDPNATGNDWDYDANKKDFSVYLNGKCKAQIKELLTNYGDVGIMWFDVPRGISQDQSQEIYDYVKSLQPNCMCSSRLYFAPGQGDFTTAGDNVVPYGKMSGNNETPATHNNTWGYKRNDSLFKPASELCEIFVELLSKNTNYLLNVGPKGDGSIPEQTITEGTKAGEWVRKNAEAIYGTQASPFDFETPNCRFTTKDNALYMFTFEKAAEYKFTGLISKILNVQLLDGTPVEFEQSENLVDIKFKEEVEKLTVIKIVTDGVVTAKHGIYPSASGDIYLPSNTCEVIAGSKVIKNAYGGLAKAQDAENTVADTLRISDEGLIINWYDTAGKVEFKFEAENKNYRAYIITQAKKYDLWRGGHTVELVYKDNVISKDLKPVAESPFKHWKENGLDIDKINYTDDLHKSCNRRYYDERMSEIGTLKLEAGENEVILQASHINPDAFNGLAVIGLVLKPVQN